MAESKVTKCTGKTKLEFYDLATKQRVTAVVTEKATTGTRFWVKGVHEGRVLSMLMGKDKWKAVK